MIEKQTTFSGFFPATHEFLLALAMNNSKPWFLDHKGEYTELLLDPMRQLVIELAPSMHAIDPEFETAPEVDKTISRIYRDIRFSKDKSPYRSNMWITFKRRNPDWKDSPAYYFEIFPDGYRYGMGYYSPSTDTMARFRKAIVAGKKLFVKAVSPLESVFTLQGEDYKKKPDAPADPLIRTWYMKKYFYLARNSGIDDVLHSAGLVRELEKGFKLLAPLYRFLMSLKGEELAEK
jgi:uncharacterized protein (TIGR02453 family)